MTTIPDPPRELWVRIAVTIAIDSVTGRAKTTVAYDGSPVGDQSVSVDTANLGKSLRAVIDIGAFSQNESAQSFETAFDNVIFDVE